MEDPRLANEMRGAIVVKKKKGPGGAKNRPNEKQRKTLKTQGNDGEELKPVESAQNIPRRGPMVIRFMSGSSVRVRV